MLCPRRGPAPESADGVPRRCVPPRPDGWDRPSSPSAPVRWPRPGGTPCTPRRMSASYCRESRWCDSFRRGKPRSRLRPSGPRSAWLGRGGRPPNGRGVNGPTQRAGSRGIRHSRTGPPRRHWQCPVREGGTTFVGSAWNEYSPHFSSTFVARAWRCLSVGPRPRRRRGVLEARRRRHRGARATMAGISSPAVGSWAECGIARSNALSGWENGQGGVVAGRQGECGAEGRCASRPPPCRVPTMFRFRNQNVWVGVEGGARNVRSMSTVPSPLPSIRKVFHP